MIETSNTISIKEDNIFENDLLDRKDAITDLSKLIESQKETLVLSVNADWGAGKTTFVRLWKAYLKTKGIESIYFSAWEDDFSNEPLVAILGELNIYIKSLDKKQTKKEFAKAKKLALKILPTLVNTVAGGVAGKLTTALIDQYQTKKTNLDKLKESISKVLDAINPHKPFVIFIDELDRCKPLYAIELLERIKHIFDIERLIFVLSMDKKNLAKSIQSQYGDIDTDNYLRRFINLEYPLKNPSVNKFCEVLYKQFELPNILNSKVSHYDYTYDLNLIQQFSTIFNLSLRQIEQFFTKLHIFFKTIPQDYCNSNPNVLFILLECLKSSNEQRYDDFLSEEITDKKTKDDKKIEHIILNGLTKDLKHYIKLIKLIKAIIVLMPLRNDSTKREDFISKLPDDNFSNFLKDDRVDIVKYINATIKYMDFAEKFDFSTNE